MSERNTEEGKIKTIFKKFGQYSLAGALLPDEIFLALMNDPNTNVITADGVTRIYDREGDLLAEGRQV